MFELINAWTQTTLGMIHALSIAKGVQMGNMNRLGENVVAAFSWIPSNIGFISSVPTRAPESKSFSLSGKNEDDIFNRVARNSCELLFTDLVVLLDVYMEILLKNKKIEPKRFPSGRIEQFIISAKYDWAKRGVQEMVVIRNCLVHSAGNWSKGAADQIQSICGNRPTVGDKVCVGFDDLFRYKRAVRTFLGEANRCNRPTNARSANYTHSTATTYAPPSPPVRVRSRMAVG